MAEQASPIADPLHDRAQVRIFTLAEYVSEEPSGKLYIGGGGLEWLGVPTVGNVLTPFYIVIRLAFPKGIVRENHAIEVRAVNDDGRLVGPNPLVQVGIQFDLDRAPENATEWSGTLPIQVADYPLEEWVGETIFLDLLADGTVISRLPVALQPSGIEGSR